MATTSILASHGILDPSDYQNDANYLHDIYGPPTNDEKSLINYYFAVQMTNVIQQEINRNLYKTEKEKLNILLNCLNDGSPVLLCFFGYFDGWQYGGHAVVAYDYEDNNYSISGKSYDGRVIIYDNNAVDFNANYCLYFNSSNGSWCIPAYSLDSAYGSQLGLITDDLSYINHHGYLNGQNTAHTEDYISVLQSAAINSDYSIKKLKRSGNGWAINSSSSDDDIKKYSSLRDNDFENSDLMFALKDSSAGYLIKTAENESLDLSIDYENFLIEAKVDNGNSAEFQPDGGVILKGSDTDYNMSMILNEGYKVNDWNEISINGKNADTAQLKTKDKGFVLKATELDDVQIKVKSDYSEADKLFSTDYNEVYIYEIDADTIGVKVDTDNNGTYETILDVNSSDAPGNSEILGDADRDGKLTVVDAVFIAKALAQKKASILPECADFNKDQKINVLDAVAIAKHLSIFK